MVDAVADRSDFGDLQMINFPSKFIELTHQQNVGIDVKQGERMAVREKNFHVGNMRIFRPGPLGRVVRVSRIVEVFDACAGCNIEDAICLCHRLAIKTPIDPELAGNSPIFAVDERSP